MTLPSDEEIREARGQYLDAQLSADALKNRWQIAQRNADALRGHYEALLEEFQGQLAIEEES